MSKIMTSPEEFFSKDRTNEKEFDTEIKIEQLTVQFPDKEGGEPVVALKNVDLAVKSGEFISLVGPSGCGKTTLLRAVADLQRPTSGSITVRGRARGRSDYRRNSALSSRVPCSMTGERYVEMSVCRWSLWGCPKSSGRPG